METETEIKNEIISVKDIVLRKIDAREVLMRSKKYFALRAIALIALAAFVFLMSASIFNFISFSLRLNQLGYPFAFGTRGFGLFFKFFPWGLLVLDVVFIIALEWLLRTFRFAYQIPSVYILLALVIVSGSIGFGIDRGTSINDRMLYQAQMHHLPRPWNDFYGGFRH